MTERVSDARLQELTTVVGDQIADCVLMTEQFARDIAAELLAARAILAGRTTRPTPAEAEAHREATRDRAWLCIDEAGNADVVLLWTVGTTGHALDVVDGKLVAVAPAVRGENAIGDRVDLAAYVRFLPLRQGLPTTWPVTP